MRRFVCLIALLALVGCGGTEVAEDVAEDASAENPLATEEQKTLYALGSAMSQQLAAAAFTEAETETIRTGLTDGLLGRKPAVDLTTYGPKIDELVRAKVAAATEAEKQESSAFYDSMAAEQGAQKTASGAIYFEVEPGTGASPAATDSVKVHYHGTLRDGRVFDSSVDKGEPATMSLGSVVPCFTEGIQRMQVGGKAKLVCPSDTAFGDRGAPPLIRPGAAIQFEVELLEIVGGS